MQQSFKLIKCPNQQTAFNVCLTHNCKSSTPFQCHNHSCKCHILHSRCKIMKIQALQDYLLNWQKWIGKQCKEFMNRVSKIYSNAKDKINREQNIFLEYCKDLFIGKDHGKVIFLLQKRQFSKISSQLLSSSINKITETNQPVSFEQFTLSQMTKVDSQIKNLTQTIQSLYKSKQIKSIHPERLARSNSATLQRNSTNNKQQSQKYMQKSLKIADSPLNQIIMLKIDLTYPKLIDSHIVQQATQINKIIGKKIKKYHLSFRATQCCFSISQFYRKNQAILLNLKHSLQKNNIKRDLLSLILVKTQFAKVIGGFTLLLWQGNKQKEDTIDSEEEQYNPQTKKQYKSKLKPDYYSSTNLFSLDLMQRYDLLKPQQAIYCGKKSMGFGKNDLRIVEKASSNRKSYCKFPNSFNYSKQPYLNMSKSGMILSGSQYSPFFKIVEWQSFIAQI